MQILQLDQLYVSRWHDCNAPTSCDSIHV